MRTSLDANLKNYLRWHGIDPDEVNAVYAFGNGCNYYEDFNPLEIQPVRDRIFTFIELKPEYENYYLEYFRIMIIFKDENAEFLDFTPRDWYRIFRELNEER